MGVRPTATTFTNQALQFSAQVSVPNGQVTGDGGGGLMTAHGGRRERVDLATREIKKGEEITVDYVLEQVPDLDFPCNCGSQSCRGFLS